MILLLLTRFCESADSLGFQLCRLLAEQGHHLYVTTTSSGDALHEEIKNASDINILSKGSITIFSPEHGKHELPSTEWITKYHDKYFSYLSRIDDIDTVIGLFPGTEQTAVKLKESLKCELILAAFVKIGLNEQNLHHFNEMLRKADELWSVGSDIYNQNKGKLHLPDINFSGKHKKILLPSKKVLVLLTTFSESPDSILGYHVCLKLVKEGHHVCVTTTSVGRQLDAEAVKARQLTQIYDGQIELLQPLVGWFVTPSPEWIQKDYAQHFSFLSKMDVESVIGTLPGTTQTAIQLKEELKCKAILLANYKLKVLTGDVMKSVRAADEVWSMGPDIYTHYEHLFHGEQQVQHEEIMLLPDRDIVINSEPHIRGKRFEAPKFVTVWNDPIGFIQNDSKEYSKGIDIEGYYTMSKALGQINAKRKLSWVIHGLQLNDPRLHRIRQNARPNMLKASTPSSLSMSDNFNWHDCFAFIVPDREEETLNFTALTAIWLGIPTLVSSQSSIGKFLLSLDCPEKFRAVVNITGDPLHDVEEWKQKVNTEILDVNPREWTVTLSEYLRSKRTFLESFLSGMTIKGESSLKPSSEAQHFAAGSGSPNTTGHLNPNYQGKPLTKLLPSSQWNNSSHRRPESMICPMHQGLIMSFYCEHCQCSLCSTCKEKSHASHETVLLREKIQEMSNNLNTFLQICNKQKREAEYKLAVLKKNKVDIENSHKEAIEEMAQQHYLIVKELSDSYQEQLERINQLTKEQLLNFEKLEKTLKEHSQSRKDLKDVAEELLDKNRMPDFIQEVNEILTSNALNEIPASTHTTCKKLYYLQPYCNEVKDPVDFRNYVQERFLGYFYSKEEDGLPQEETTNSTRSFEGDSMATHITSASIMALQSKVPIIKQALSPLELISITNINIFEGSHLKTFSSVLFSVNSLWICGWNKNWRQAKTTVLLNVDLPEYNVLAKEKKTDSNADLPTIMVPHGDNIIFTMKGGNEIFSLNTKTKTFRVIYTRPKLKVAAMCGGDYNLFLLDRKELGHIKILDSSFEAIAKITTGLWDYKGCDIDMCLVKESSSSHTIVISTSFPKSSVRAVNQQSAIWMIDCNREPLDALFNPCSVSSSLTGSIFVADRGKDKIYTISNDGKKIEAVLDKEKGIRAPTRLRVDDEGNRLVIINKDGREIRNYKINMGLSSIFEDILELEEDPFPAKEVGAKILRTSRHNSVHDDQEGLTDAKILELSKQFTSKQDLQEVAIKGLNIPSRTVERHIQNNQNRYNEAAFCLFQEWRDTQENPTIACDQMRQALENAGKSLFKQAL